MPAPVDPSQLDFRFSGECPDCGQQSGWMGGVEREGSRTYLDLACPACGYRYQCFRAEWEPLFADWPQPQHSPGAS